MKKVLFVHVPRTSGTSLVRVFKDTLPDFFVQANAAEQLASNDPRTGRVRDLEDIKRVLSAHGGLAIHVDSNFDRQRRTSDFRSLAWYLFDPRYVAYFSQFTILTMLRDPFRSFLSTYGFVVRTKQRDPGFLPDLDVGSLESYLDQVHENAMLHFLLEPQLSRRRVVTREELDRVKAAIANYPIHVGLYERYEQSIAYFARVLDRTFRASDVPVLNAGGSPGAIDSRLEAMLYEKFYEKNRLDYELYEFVSARAGFST